MVNLGCQTIILRKVVFPDVKSIANERDFFRTSFNRRRYVCVASGMVRAGTLHTYPPLSASLFSPGGTTPELEKREEGVPNMSEQPDSLAAEPTT